MKGFQEKLKSPDLTVMLGGKQDVAQWTDSESNLNITEGKKALVGSFFYNSRAPQNKTETSHTEMLQSLLYQLLKQEEDLFPIFRKRFVELRDLRSRHGVRDKSDQVRFDWPFETLLSILSSILNLIGRSCVLYIFIDAMDESDATDRSSVLSVLTHTDAVEVKTMIASRPLGPQKPILGYEIILEQHNSKDIERIVESKVSLFMGLTPQTEIPNYDFRLFQEKVIHLADGVILWVSLVLSITESLFEDGPPPSDEMMQTLENLPDDMERLYIGIIDRLKLKPTNVEKGKQWLKWATFSARLLDLNEFRDAIAVSELGSKYNGNPTTLRPKKIGSSFKTAEGNLRRICGGFVELKSLRLSSTALQSVQSDELASSTAIQLLHQTVKLFLQKEKASPFNSFKPEGDLLIATSCSRYLLALSEGSLLPLVGLKQATTWDMGDYECFVHHIESLPLLNYVFTFLPYHLISRSDLDDLNQIINIVGANQLSRYLIASWASQILLDCKQRPGKQRVTILDPKRWLHFWSHQPSIRLSERETLFMPKFITTALVAAVKTRSFIAVKALIAAGAAVDTTCDLNAASALDVAATEGQLDIFTYLARYATNVPIPIDSSLIDSPLDSQPLVNRADSLVTRVGPSTNSALHVAAGNGNVSQVRWLLDAGAQPDSRDDQNRSAVHIAALLGHAESINLLLDAGADVDSKDNLGRTPLMLVAENGHIDAARVLLDHNADLELKSNSGATPYSLAHLHNHKTIIQLLYRDQEPNAANSEHLSTFLVPFSRSRDFVGRELILKNIWHLTQWQGDQVIALVGLGGVGYVLHLKFLFVTRQAIA
jgi:ankyrin repeat protein